MKDRKQRRGLKGAVLIMVLTVMFVLIILLMATLTVVTTANQRIYTKFEENQAYYTARSALDVYTSMLGDSTYQSYSTGSAVNYTYGAGSTGPMKQGLALQLDLYSIEAVDESGVSANLMGNIPQSVLNSYANTVSDKAEYKTSGGSNNYGMVTGKDKIVYQIKLPEMVDSNDASKKYGKLVDVDSSTNLQEVTITVQVLSREYNFGEDVSSLNPVTDSTAFAKAMVNGDRKKDSMRLKIIAEATFVDTVGTAVLICDARELPVNNSAKALTAFGNASLNNMNILDGISTLKDVTWGNQGNIYGPVYVEGFWHAGGGGPRYYLTESECFYVTGNVSWQNSFNLATYGIPTIQPSDPILTVKENRPFLYVGGIFGGQDPSGNYPNGVTVGTATAEEYMDLLTNGLRAPNNGLTYYGDIYCKGICDFSAATNVNITGDLFIDGKLVVNVGNNNWQYNPVQNKLNVPAGVNVYFSPTSQIEAAGTSYSLTFGSASTYGYDSFGSLGKGINSLAFAKGDSSVTPNPNPNDNPATECIEAKLPNGITKKIPTHELNYSSFYKVDSNGKLVDSSGNPTTNPSDYVPIAAEEYAFTKKSDLARGKYSNKEFNTTDVGTTATLSCAANNGGLLIDGAAAGSWDIDTATMSTKYVLSNSCGSTQKYGAEGGDKNNYMYIHGGGTVDFLLQPGGLYEGNIVVADDTQLNIYAPAGSYNLEKFCVWTDTTFAAYKNSSDLNVGHLANTGIVVPKINYYFAAGSTINTINDFILTGYVYGPGAEWTVGQSKSMKFNLNGNSVGTVDVSFVGSVLCKKLVYSNAVGGVAYINPDLASTPVTGDPPLRFESYHYERN